MSPSDMQHVFHMRPDRVEERMKLAATSQAGEIPLDAKVVWTLEDRVAELEKAVKALQHQAAVEHGRLR